MTKILHEITQNTCILISVNTCVKKIITVKDS